MPEGQGAAVRESLGIPQAHRYVMFLGRLVNHHKGVDLLVSAFRALAARFPDLHLVIVGSGPDEPALHEQARSIPRVHFLGWVSSRQRVQELLGASEVVACPSHEDAFPYTVAEAMTAGRPLVASAVGGICDLVADGQTGYLIPPGDPGALERALERILRNPGRAEAMGLSGRARIEQEFAEAVLVPRLAGMLRAAVSRSPRGPAGAVAGAQA
jgi:glycosyltransferase involved in cell wall biosynthesis